MSHVPTADGEAEVPHEPSTTALSAPIPAQPEDVQRDDESHAAHEPLSSAENPMRLSSMISDEPPREPETHAPVPDEVHRIPYHDDAYAVPVPRSAYEMPREPSRVTKTCLLYTSDAADE